MAKWHNTLIAAMLYDTKRSPYFPWTDKSNGVSV